MQFRELAVPGAWVITPTQLSDSRGTFMESFSAPAFTTTIGHPLDLRQVNTSISAAGVLRGIHFADVPPSQAKYVTCTTGAVLDVVVDIRLGSPTYGQWDSVVLDDVDRRAVYVSEGLGHAFCSLEEGSTVIYLCSATYAPGREHGINPLDPDLAIDWPTTDRHGRPIEHTLSDKDRHAPSLDQARAEGLLPTLADVQAHLATLGE